MADFDAAIGTILAHEGGFVDDPNDHGGATNWGVSLRYLINEGGLKKHPELDLDHDGDLDAADMRLMTKDQASAVYRSDWWDRFGYGQINDQNVATKIFDMAVNMGPVRAHKLLQAALGVCGKPVGIDGLLGPKSFQAVNSSDPAGLLHVVCQKQADFYRAIVNHDPSQAKFLAGWLRRAAA